MDILKKAAAESIGTFALVFAGCGAIMVHSLYPLSLSTENIPVVFGLIVTAMVYTLGHVSGAHINPAVSIAFAITKRFAWKQVPIYILAQLLGAVAAIALLAFLMPEAQTFGQTVPTVDAARAFVWEAALTFILMFVVMSVATDSRAVGVMAGIAIGTTVALDAFIGGPATGASMNPARSIAPALFAGEFKVLWIYIIAPCIGAALGALAYECIRCDSPTEKKDAKGCC